MSDDEHERREAIAKAEFFNDSTDDVRHLPHGEAGIPSDGRRVVCAIDLQPGPPGAERRLVNAPPPRRQPRKDHAQDERHEGKPAERRHQHGAPHWQPASQVHVVAEKASGAPVQPPRVLHQAIPPGFDFGDVVFGTDHHRTERPRMRVGHPLVIHRHVEEAGGAQRLAGRLDLLQVAAKRFLPLVDAENRLKRGRRRWRRWWWCTSASQAIRIARSNAWCRMRRQRTPSSRRSSDSSSHTPWRPLLHDRRIEAAELCDVEERPRALDRRRRQCNRALIPQQSRSADTGPPNESCRAASSSAARSNSRRTARYPRSVTVRSRAGTRSGRSSICRTMPAHPRRASNSPLR